MPLQCSAASEDYLENLTIQADSLEINLKDKQANLKGNIKVESDSLSATADGISIIFIQNSQTNEMQNLMNNTDKIDKFRLYVDKGYITASIKKNAITYHLKCKEIIGNMSDKKIIISDATIYDGMNNIVGEKIIYDMNSKQLSVKSNQNNKVRISIKKNGSKEIK
jgi:lipopolysaccharide transport protein LptA